MTSRLWDLGKAFRSRVEEFFDEPLRADATPLELLGAALERIETMVQPAGLDRRVFPYDRLLVTVRQPGVDAAAIEAVFAEFDNRVQHRLAELRCEPRAIVSELVVDAEAGGEAPVLVVQGFRDEAARPASEPAPRTCPLVRIAVEKGACTAPEYVFQEPLIAIGRTADPTDVHGQIRRNHVVFADTPDGVTETVGRAHARLELDGASGHYHLFHESGSNPTAIVRGGRMLRVAPRDPRGIRVQSGDRIHLGRAVLALTIEA